MMGYTRWADFIGRLSTQGLKRNPLGENIFIVFSPAKRHVSRFHPTVT